ncbi:MAG: hypothetical protein AAGK78_03870, partial [Planctomycetota bacterium]
VLFGGLFRGDKTLRNVGLAVLGVGGAWAAATHFVATDLEQAELRTRGLVESYEAGDWTQFESLLDSSTRLDTELVGEQIVHAAQATHERLNHDDVRVIMSEPKQLGPDTIEVRIEVSSRQAVGFFDGPITTGWNFLYTRRAGNWVLDRIEILPTQFLNPERVRRNIVRGREQSRTGAMQDGRTIVRFNTLSNEVPYLLEAI